MKPIITVNDLRLYYGDVEALHGISMEFNKNEITALIGPSGSGKSTFLHCLNRMHDRDRNVKITGSINYQDKNIYAPSIDLVKLRRDIGMVFQQPVAFPFSIFDNVAYGLRLAGEKNKQVISKKVEESLKQAALWDEVKDDLAKNALGLSGGQQQRLCIARALAIHPDVLLLDESTSALDPVSSSKIEETLYNLKDQYTIIMVTHNLQQAARITDITAVLMRGNLVEVGKTRKMFLQPDNQKVDDYLRGKLS